MRPIIFPYKIYRGLASPIVPIGLHGPRGWRQSEAYVDSGAFVSIFTVAEADRIGVPYETGKEHLITVGDGSLIRVYLHQLLIQIGDQRLRATIGFAPRLGVGFNLMGRQDIFTHFDVTFRDARRQIVFRPISVPKSR